MKADLSLVYVFLMFTEIISILKYINIPNRFKNHTYIKTALLISVSVVRIAIFGLIFIGVNEYIEIDQIMLSRYVRILWWIVAFMWGFFQIFDFITVAQFKKKRESSTLYPLYLE